MQIKEHMEVVGSDGQHVGTVDGVEDDRIKLTKSDSGTCRTRWMALLQRHCRSVSGRSSRMASWSGGSIQ
jgi:hypothetical protein